MRGDLPSIGIVCAQITHAAGESARLAPELPANTRAIVLAVADEQHLLAVEARLAAAGARYSLIREPDRPFNGAATALGVVLGMYDVARKLLSSLPLLSEHSHKPQNWKKL